MQKASFTDDKGRMWVFAINGHTHQRIKAMIGYDIMALLADDAAFAALAGDYDRQCELMWVIVEGQHEGVVFHDFIETMYGDYLEEASQGLIHGLGNFIPNQEMRKLFFDLLEKGRLAQNVKFAKIGANADQLVEEAMQKKPSQPPTTTHDTFISSVGSLR